MKHTLRIGVCKEHPPIGPNRAGRIVSCRHVTVRERMLRFLLGDKRRLTVIVPGNSVKTLSIIEEGGDDDVKDVRT